MEQYNSLSNTALVRHVSAMTTNKPSPPQPHPHPLYLSLTLSVLPPPGPQPRLSVLFIDLISTSIFSSSSTFLIPFFLYTYSQFPSQSIPMPVELRKRKAPQPPPAPAPAPKKSAKAKKASPAKEERQEEEEPKDASQPREQKQKSTSVAVGDVIDLQDFGGEIEDQNGCKTTLKKLVDDCKTAVVLFTYPKASTPGCTVQACLFRDAYEPLLAEGLSVYGLSTDQPKANTSFKEKQKLQYPLLCDPQATLIGAIGFKKQPKGTQRGVFVVDKKGKVLVCQPGGPAATVDRVKQLVEELSK
ncbi:hypothetical protein XA68_10311 [Ophiocordyceps unilateralis]|uniref:thioredoxin-dependent peroxiredoxin n=1 Tax=Ophiocordyceps unilateralis TaxID=268505 RepID=A0A2A9PIT7_OPHUN|nr:hypothetical protein XA68_10311 [Ophiocordyceps unilateralis]